MKRSRLKALLFHLAFWALLVLCIVGSVRSGGTVLPLDFLGGYSVYVESGYSSPTETQPPIWMVSDDDVKKDIFRLCKKIEQYRECIPYYDVMLGASQEFEYFPRLYLLTDSYIYRIDILNWDNYTSDSWREFPIRQEKFGEPVLHLWRVNRADIPEGESIFASSNFRSDSLNGYGGSGWYCTVTQKELEALLALLQSVGPDNAVVTERYE